MESIKIPVKYKDLDDGLEKFKLEDWPIMDPHSVAHFLWEHAGLRTPCSALSQYWQHHSAHGLEWAKDVPLDTHPIGIYGDGARVATKFGHINLIGIWFNFVLWKPRSVRASRFLLFSIPEHQLWKHFTLNVVMRRVTWSINALINGYHPATGPYQEELLPPLCQLAGKPFAHKCALTEVRGDWSWLKKLFRFHRCSWNGILVCHHCPARSSSNDPQDLYWRFENNNWDDKHFQFEEFIDERMPPHHMCTLIYFIAWPVCICPFHC